MAYDQELAGRIRELIGSDADLTEKKMFGGLAFLISGNMAIAASAASVMVMRGRAMPGWLHISSDHLRTDEDLTAWVDRGTGYARTLPPK